MKQGARYVAGGLLAAALLWVVFRGVSLAALAENLRNVSWPLLLAGAALNLGHNVFRVWRWGALLEPVSSGIPFRPRFVTVIVGYLTTWTIPGRLGELVRPALLSVRARIPLGPCLGSVLADRLLDGVAVVALCGAGLWLAPPAEGEGMGAVKASLWFMVLVVAAFLVFFLVSSALSGSVAGWIERRRGAVRWTGRAWLELARGTEALRSPGSAAKVLLYSLLIWATIALATWLGVRSVGAEVGFGAILVLMPLLALGVAVPTPSGAGSYHAAMKYGLMLFYGVPPETAVAAGVLMHLANVLPVVLLGLWFLHSERISWHDLLEAARQVRRLGADPARIGNGRPAEGLP